MNVAIGADHAGFAAKEEIKAVIKALGHVPVDKGTASEISVDYPDFAQEVSKSVLAGWK
jgi:ribose 5-phosphate isomerase B